MPVCLLVACSPRVSQLIPKMKRAKIPIRSLHAMVFGDVSFEFEEGVESTGQFSMIFCNGEIQFEWIPSASSSVLDNHISIDKCRFLVRLCEITEINLIDEGFNIVSLQFTCQDDLKLPPFRFNKNSKVRVMHLLEFLEYRKYIFDSSNHKKSFDVLLAFEPLDQTNNQKSYITPQQVIAFASHKKVIRNILAKDLSHEDEPLSVDDCKVFFQENGVCSHFTNLKREVFRRGLTTEARTLVWPYLLGVLSPSKNSEANEAYLSEKVKEYQAIKAQWSSLLPEQRENMHVMELERVIDNDVKRTDRTLPQFLEDDHPNLLVLHNVLISYALYNKDTGYVQGMGDFVSPFIVLYIKEWKDKDNAIMYDGRVVTRDEAESFIMWHLCGLMSVTQHDRMFTDLLRCQEFAMERTMKIISIFHPALNTWLIQNELSNLIFLYRPFLLLFKREFDTTVVARMWDSLFSCERAYSFPRFFLVSIAFLLFPKLLLHTNGSIGDVMAVTDSNISKIDAHQAMNLSIGLEENLSKYGHQYDFVLQPMPQKAEYRDYNPSYFHINL